MTAGYVDSRKQVLLRREQHSGKLLLLFRSSSYGNQGF
jgi:hypothetical protein